jgi:uncharacterized protein YbjT (DUF2867 family)
MKISIIGSTGMLAQPVARQLEAAGHDVTRLSRQTGTDVFDLDSLKRAFETPEVVYLNLANRGDARPHEPHPEREGLRNVIDAARAQGVGRLAFISSMVKDYQGMNGFHWWAFDVKRQAVEMIRASGIPFSIFYPSSFMENLAFSQKSGSKIMLAGKSNQRMYFIAGEDYGRQVARAFAIAGSGNQEYPVQGPQPFTYREAADEFIRHYTKEQLRTSTAPQGLLDFLGLFTQSMHNTARIVRALNEYPETFVSERTWADLGKPEITLAEFARRASQA